MISSAPGTRNPDGASSRAAILDAAVEEYARAGPDGASLRDVARSAGLTHALVARYFGSKDNLVAAVGDLVTTQLMASIDELPSVDADGFAAFLRSAHDDRTTTRLLIRCALGDLRPSGFPACLVGHRTAPRSPVDRRTRLCRYGAASTLLGWLTFDGFLTASVGLDRMSRTRREAAIAGTAARILALAPAAEPAFVPRPSRTDPPTGDERPDRPAADALLDSAIELFALHGPASVSIRQIARRAGVNHGLVHRHFGSKDDLLTEALEVGTSSLLGPASAPDGFDIDEVVRMMHHESPAPRLIARILVDDIPIDEVRRHYPLMRALSAVARAVPRQWRWPEIGDPRLAVVATGALVGGSSIWGPALREVLDLEGDPGVESAVADLGREVLGIRSGPDTEPTEAA